MLGGSLGLLRDLSGGLLRAGGYDLWSRLCRLGTGLSRLSWCLLGGSLGLLRDLSGGLLWTGGYDLRSRLCGLISGLGRLSALSWLCCGLWSLRLRGDDLWLCWGTCWLLRRRGNQLG